MQAQKRQVTAVTIRTGSTSPVPLPFACHGHGMVVYVGGAMGHGMLWTSKRCYGIVFQVYISTLLFNLNLPVGNCMHRNRISIAGQLILALDSAASFRTGTVIVCGNTPGTAGGPGGRDRTLAVKSRKTAENSVFLAQAACVCHACLRAPCVAWP